MFKVTIDATPLMPNPSGVGAYIVNLIQSLSILQEQEKYKFNLGIAYQPSWRNWLARNFTLPEQIIEYSNLYLLPIPVQVSSKLSSFPGSLLFDFDRHLGEPDIIHGTDYSVFPCRNAIELMNIYDLTFFKYPEYINSSVKTYTRRVRQSLQWADLILTISQSSKQDIIDYLQIPPERIYVTPLASKYPVGYTPNLSTEICSKVTKYDFSRPYILFVSTIEPRKNVESIISAFERLKERNKIPHNLVLIGKKGWKYEPIFERINLSIWKEYIQHLDYLSDELVAIFYSKADVFVYPSHYEGFGIPVLEAMTLGAPVVTSNTSSLPEVAGDAALLVDPNNLEELVAAILNIIEDHQLRYRLIESARERAKLFTWKRTAQETLQIYNYCCELKNSKKI